MDINNTAIARTRDIIAKSTFTVSMNFLGDAYARAGNPVYAYHYGYKTAMDIECGFGARHGGEGMLVFDNLRPDASESDKILAKEMHNRWVNFIKTGDPNNGLSTPSGVVWPKYDPESSMMLYFNNKITSEIMPEKENMKFLEELLFGAK